MKKISLSILMLTVVVFMSTSCKSTQKSVEVKAPISSQTNVDVYDVPCWMADDDEWFYATIQRQFKQSSMNTAPTATLRSAQMLMRQKLSSVYRAVLRDYFDQMDIEEGSYANQHIESAGDLVIKATINETYEVCRKQTRPDENGNVTMYMTIKVSKKKFTNDLVQKISDDEQLKVRFNEKTFRDSAFKVFRESNNKEFNEFKEQQF